MLVLSLLFLTVLFLLIYSLTKDTGRNTIYARHQAMRLKNEVEHKQEEDRSVNSAKVVKVS